MKYGFHADWRARVVACAAMLCASGLVAACGGGADAVETEPATGAAAGANETVSSSSGSGGSIGAGAGSGGATHASADTSTAATSSTSTSSSGSGGSGVTADDGLSAAGHRFAIDGKQTFLLGISYFSCLYAPMVNIKADFDVFVKRGITIVRCWVNWPIHYDTWDTQSADNFVLVRADGSLDPAALDKLNAIVDLATSKGLVIDITFNQDTPNKTFAAHKAGIVATAKALAGSSHVLFDMQNEANHSNTDPADFMTADQALEARNAVLKADPERLVTASTTTLSALVNYVETAKLGIAAYHCCRKTLTNTDWPAETLTAVKNARAALPGTPLYMQEPNRCGDGHQYATCNGSGSEFLDAASNAKKGGAAAWVLHTMAGYDLRTKTLMSQLNATEIDALDSLATKVGATAWGP